VILLSLLVSCGFVGLLKEMLRDKEEEKEKRGER